MIEKIKTYAAGHKKMTVSIIIVLLIAIYGLTKVFSGGNTQTTYLVGAAEKNTIISSVSGTGQVSALNQIDLKSEVSGDVVYVGVTNGQKIKTGTLIAQLDARDAEIALENAQISYEKLVAIDALDVTKAEDALTNAKDSSKKANDDLIKSYDDGFTTVADTFTDLPDTMSGLDDLLNNYDDGYLNSNKVRPYGLTAMNYFEKASDSYEAANKAYRATLADYKVTSRTSSSSTIEDLIAESYTTTKAISQAVKDAKNLFDYVKDQNSNLQNSTAETDTLTNLTSWSSNTNSALANLLAAKNDITNAKDTLVSSRRTVAEKQADLNELKNGADPLDIRSQQLTLEQKRTDYDKYFIRAAFDGTVANMDLKKGNTLSSNSSFGSLITSQKIAEITLNEVDVANVKVGQPATMTFDALPDLTITGKVIDVDLIGTASQGVVSYDVKIIFDIEDEQVKSGMSVSASIITSSKQNILTVPNEAIKSQNDSSYVLKVDNNIATTTGNNGLTLTTAPTHQEIVTGISDDSNTEIISGLEEGDKIITKTITGTATTKNTNTSSVSSLLSGKKTTTSGTKSGSTNTRAMSGGPSGPF